MGHGGDTVVFDQERDVTFRLMFERSADAILLIDAASNQFVDYNQATLDMLCCSREELSSLHPSALSPPTQPDGRESFEKANEMIAIAVREGSHRFEWIHRSPHRPDFPVEVLLTPLLHGDRQLIVTVWRDITERKRSERALLEAQKMESIALLAGGVAHDFNNLLTAALGHLHLSREGAPPASLAHIGLVEHALSRAADLTRQLLAYSGRGRFVVEPLDLGAVADEMTSLLRGSVPASVELVCEIGEARSIEADRAQVQQVLLNLITNAVESIGDAHGRVTVRVSGGRLSEPDIRRDYPGESLRAGDVVHLSVEDSGRGMSAATLTRVFEPYFTTKSAGRGLGLAALRGILKSHGAAIAIKSVVGRGTTVDIAWPASSAPARERPADVVVAAVEPRGSGTVLVVDDDDLVRRSTATVLESLGYSVLHARDGESAVRRFQTDREAIGWVLMDLTMPRMDGYSAFLELRAIDPSVTVVLCSGWTETEIARRFAACAPAGFLPKPFTTAELVELLRRLGLLESGPRAREPARGARDASGR
ncbi:MAG: response regulator [Deltaproteobacteria bacterium]|nr:response regulator [Deltaproteobacteria bacterium]